jgi:hypothetical protein
MKIHLAIISTESGIEVLYAGGSHKAAKASVAKWCREYWLAEDVDVDTGIEDPSTLSDKDVIREYFMSESVLSIGETCEITEVEYQE